MVPLHTGEEVKVGGVSRSGIAAPACPGQRIRKAGEAGLRELFLFPPRMGSSSKERHGGS